MLAPNKKQKQSKSNLENDKKKQNLTNRDLDTCSVFYIN